MKKYNTTRYSSIIMCLLCGLSLPVSGLDELRVGKNDQKERHRKPINEGSERKKDKKPKSNAERYTLAQAISDKAQLHTISFNGLAFITGDFGAATFIPPGKVCDYFGFQYMRDIDAANKGHNPIFLNRISANVLSILDDKQRNELKELAEKQAPGLRNLALMRLPLIKAFYEAKEGKGVLNRSVVISYVGDIFTLDMDLSISRAALFGKIASSLNPVQKKALDELKFGDFNSWKDIDSRKYKLPKGSEKMINVAYMTYASEFFSFYKGSVLADTYFCPERHGTYFGGFYMKDMPVMGKRDMDISTSITGDSGADFLNILTLEQRKKVEETIELQWKAVKEIADLRKSISEQLRLYLNGKTPDRKILMAMGRRYGQLDGEMSYYYASAFVTISQTLTEGQLKRLKILRNLEGYNSAPYYIYSAPQKDEAPIGNFKQFFDKKK